LASFNDIKNALHDWAAANTPGSPTVRWDNEGGGVADRPYLILALPTFTQVGHEDIGSPDEVTGNAEIIFQENFTLSILGFGLDIIENTKLLRQSLGRPSVQATLRSAGIVIVDPLPVLDITEVTNDSTYEERSSCDVVLRMSNVFSDEEVGVIENMEGTGTYKQPGRPDIVETIEVTTP
jgi:hypothetical protein